MSPPPHDVSVRWQLLQSLPFRVVAFLSLALLPIGLLAMWQTQNLDETLRARTSLSLVALTELAASGERQTLQRAVGAAMAQSVVYKSLQGDPARCRTAFTRFVDANPVYSFAGFLPPTGPMTCSSEQREITVDLGMDQAAIAKHETPKLLSRLRNDPANTPVAILLQPVFEGGAVIGQLVLSLPTALLSEQRDLVNAETPLSLVIYNNAGNVIAIQGDKSNAPEIDTTDVALAPEGTEPSTYVGRNAAGERRVFVTLTLVPGLAYAIGSWAPKEGFLATDAVTLPSFFLPALMWLASLLVAYFAVHRLVVSPVQDLRNRMRLFASNRALPQPNANERLPLELADLEQTFTNMAYDLMDDEARMEDSLREKNVLLKEVHHRVKNNLQMISSIMNMQIRTSIHEDSRRALKRLQDRVLGLATVHRFLYQSENLGRTEAAPLMAEICENLFQILAETHPQTDTRLETDNFKLIPDQAVPLALLVGEVGTNAIKHMRHGSRGDDFLHFSLKITSPGMAQFRCRNSAGTSEKTTPAESREDGIGRQLIRAFAMQLGGPPEITDAEGIHTVVITFPITALVPDALDY